MEEVNQTSEPSDARMDVDSSSNDSQDSSSDHERNISSPTVSDVQTRTRAAKAVQEGMKNRKRLVAPKAGNINPPKMHVPVPKVLSSSENPNRKYSPFLSSPFSAFPPQSKSNNQTKTNPESGMSSSKEYCSGKHTKPKHQICKNQSPLCCNVFLPMSEYRIEESSK